jgi:hypothetical protein
MKFDLKVRAKGVIRSHLIEAVSEEHAKQKIALMYLKYEILSICSEHKTSKLEPQAIPNFLLKK